MRPQRWLAPLFQWRSYGLWNCPPPCSNKGSSGQQHENKSRFFFRKESQDIRFLSLLTARYYLSLFCQEAKALLKPWVSWSWVKGEPVVKIKVTAVFFARQSLCTSVMANPFGSAMNHWNCTGHHRSVCRKDQKGLKSGYTLSTICWTGWKMGGGTQTKTRKILNQNTSRIRSVRKNVNIVLSE